MATRARTAEQAPATERVETRSPVTAGVLAGLAGGILMALWSMGYAGVTGIGFYMPLKLIASMAYGIEALVGGPGVLLTGAAIHMVTAAAYGALFALILPRRAGAGTGLLAGLVYGGAILVFMTFIALPAVNEIMRERVELIPFSWIVTHLIFGATVGLMVPALRHRTRS